jgi:chromosome segregation ATPase
LLFFLLSVSFLSAQSIEQLKKDLAKAKTSKEKMLLNYQLADTYFKASSMRKKERFENAETYAKEAHRLAGQTGNNGMTAQSAYLLAKTYNNLKTVGEKSRRSRYSKNVDVWLKNAAASAELVGDYDLILNVYQERANLYTSGKDKNYRKAFQVMEEGLGVLTKNGKSISQLQNNYDRTEVKLSGNLQELRDEIRKLESEKGQLEKKNVNLTQSNKQAKKEISQKETVIREKDEVILAKEDSLEIAEQKAEKIEEKAKKYEAKVANLTEEAAKDRLVIAEAKAEVEEARAVAAEQELKTKQAEELRNYLIIGAGIILLLAILFYARYISKKRANRTLKEEQERSEKLLLNI